MGDRFEDGFMKGDEMWATVVDEEHKPSDIHTPLYTLQKNIEGRIL